MDVMFNRIVIDSCNCLTRPWVQTCLCVSGKFKLNMPETKCLDFQSAPSFTVPLKRRTAPQGYECYMTCAVSGDPTPRVTWYRDDISLNTNTNYHITNVCGVCSLLILRVAPKDNGQYKIVIENKLGTAECSMTLNVRGINTCTRFNNCIFLCKDTDKHLSVQYVDKTNWEYQYVSLQSEDKLQLLDRSWTNRFFTVF